MSYDPGRIGAIFTPPDKWCRVELPNCVAYAPEVEMARGGIEYAQLIFAIVPLEIEPGESVEHASEILMARRVRQGVPTRFPSQVAGIRAQGFAWTDGIADIVSFFVSAPDGELLEFNVSRSCFQEHALPLEGVASDLLSRVHWSES